MGKNLTRQDMAITALLAHGSVREAARATGIGEATFYRWLKTPDFSAAYRKARKDVMEASVARLQAVSSEAVETLVRNLRCENPAVEVRTAAIILEQAQKGLEATEMIERIEELEKIAGAIQPQGGRR